MTADSHASRPSATTLFRRERATSRQHAFLAILLTALALLFSARGVDAQSQGGIYEQGFKPYGSFEGGDIDVVNLMNRALTLRIPVASYPQRGGILKMEVAHTYTSRLFQGASISGGPGCTQACYTFNFPDGFSSPSGVSSGPVDMSMGVERQISNPWNVYAIAPDASLHLVGSSNVAVDGTGYRVGPKPPATCPSTEWVTGPKGVTYKFECTATTQFYYYEDANGNRITRNVYPSPSGFTDTMNRTINFQAITPAYQTSDLAGCTGALPTASAYLWSIPGMDGGTQTFKLCQANITVNVPCTGRCSTANGTYLATQTIVNPNGTAWIFQYDSADPANPNSVAYGDLLKVIFPTGGSLSYTWASANATFECSSGALRSFLRVVATRTMDANDGRGPRTWTYDGAPYTTTQGQIATTVVDPLGNETIHLFTLLPDPDMPYGLSCSAYETLTQVYQGTSTAGTLLKTVATEYALAQILPSGIYEPYPSGLPSKITTTLSNGQQQKVEMDYNYPILNGSNPVADGNVLARREYDYGSGAPGPLLRTTSNTYMDSSNSNYLNSNLLTLLSSVSIKNGAGVQQAYTSFNYDEYALAPSGVSAQLDSSPPNGNYRGNLTSTRRWLSGSAASTPNCPISVSGGYLVSYNTFFDTGMVQKATDSCGASAGSANHTTTFAYSTVYDGAYPTTVTNPLGQSTTNAYDFNTGVLTSTMDSNNQTTSYSYDSLTGRVTQIGYPGQGQVNYCYTDSQNLPCYASLPPYKAITTKKITSSQNLITTSVFDGFGRPTQTQLNSDPDGVVYTDTTYDVLGRAYCTSNPYRVAGESTSGITTTRYDALGRATQTQPPDYWATNPSSSPTCATVTPATTPANPSNQIVTSYSGNATTVTDQSGKSRKTISDGLGRLTQVFEDPANLNYETDYTYDALGNLLTVNQKGGSTNSALWRTRIFTYDSLSRLTQATNPESGTIHYSYDANGNLLQKISPAPNQTGTATATLSYCYDALNRNTSKAYTAQSCPMSSPVASYLYDQSSYNGLTITNGIGRRTGMTDQAGSEAWSYDVMGSVATDQRTTNSQSKTVTYTHNLDGSLYGLSYPTYANGTYPANLTYTTGGAGRPLALMSGTSTFVGDAHYTPSGANCYLQDYWDGTWTSVGTFNNRLQPKTYQVQQQFSGTQPSVCTAMTTVADVMDFTYNFVDSSSHNNGNVQSISNNRDWRRTQSFTYDSLSRISTAQTGATNQPAFSGDTGSIAACWAETYTYDPWGNILTLGPNTTTQPSYVGCTQESGFNYTGAIGANNRIAETGFTYDAAGNMTVSSGAAYVYDAENHLLSAGGVTYTYDGDGKRVMKSSGTLYWYGAGSNAFMETDLSNNMKFNYFFFNGQRVASENTSNQINWYFADHLGSSRVVWSLNGADDSDYYPFGAERAISSGANNHYKFTGKERDPESGLDNFGARYNSSSLGRFMRPDPSNVGAAATDPQSWNTYAYAGNNPINFGDPDGLDYKVCVNNDNGGQNCTTYNNYNDFQKAANASGATLSGNDKNGQILVNGNSVGTYSFFPDPGTAPEETVLAPTVFFAAAGAVQGLFRAGTALVEDLLGAGGRAGVETVSGLYGTVTREALEAAANSGGPTVRVVTNLTQAPAAGRALSVAAGQGAEALANAAREGGTTYIANIPKALLDQMTNAGLVQGSTTSMGGTVAQELRFAPQAAEFVVKFFRAVH